MKLFESSEARKEAGHALFDLLYSNREKSILLMLSGGSALTILDFVNETALSTNLTLTTLDERFSTDPLVNNFLQLTNTEFYKRCIDCGVSVISTVPENNETLSEMNTRVESTLRAWRAANKEGVVIVTMGIGTDGHTAGIFKEAYDETAHNSSWVVGYIVPGNITPHQARITVTKTFLRLQTDHTIVYAAGPEKRALLHELETDIVSNQVPMKILTLMKDVSVYIESQ